MSGPAVTVQGNKPRLLKPGEVPPPTQPVVSPEEISPVSSRYWTEERAAQAYAFAWKNLADYFNSPGLKAAKFETDMMAPALANVLEDWWPVKAGEGSDKRTNLIVLAIILGLFVAMRLPAILAVVNAPKEVPAGHPNLPQGPPAETAPAPARNRNADTLRDVVGQGGAYYPGPLRGAQPA